MFSPNAGLASPLSAKGDIWTYTTTDAKLALGSNGLFLSVDTSTSTGLAWASPAAAAIAVTIVTSGVTLTASIDVMYVNGGGSTFAITLPNGASTTVKPFRIVRTDTSVTLPISIIGLISGSTNWALYTPNEAYTIIPHGSTTSFMMLSHDTETEWTSTGVMGITATTTGPTKGQTQAIDVVYWRRSGDTCYMRQNFRQTSATSSAAGSGDYLWQVNQIGAIDTNKITVYGVTIEGWSSSYEDAFTLGMAAFGNNSNQGYAHIVAWDLNTVRLLGQDSATAGAIGSAGYPLTGAQVFYSLNFHFPVSGWKS